MLTRDEATAACRNVRNLWPRDESEALRYRRQVVAWPGWDRFVSSQKLDQLGSCITKGARPIRIESADEGLLDISPDVKAWRYGPARCPKGYALVEWLAPDGRCADHGDVERHGEHRVYRNPTNGRWLLGNLSPIDGCAEADRFRGHEGDPWCGEYHLMPGLVRADYHEGDGMRLYKAPRGPDGSILAVPVPRERLTAEHPDHARHEAELFGPGEGNLIGGVVVYPSHPPRSRR